MEDPFSTPFPIPAVATIKITGPGTRKRTVAEATVMLAETNMGPTVGWIVTGITGTVGVAVNAGVPRVLSTDF